jgi:hypothetical protein
MTFEDPKDRVIFSLLRLRLPEKSVSKNHHSEKLLSCPEDTPADKFYSPYQEKKATILSVLPELEGAALIREIHTF